MSLQSALARFGFGAATANGTYSPSRQQTMARIQPAELPPRALYDFLKSAYLSNGFYDGVRDAWAATGYASPALKAIRNPVTAVVDVLGSKLYPEPLQITTPLTQSITSQQERETIEANDPIKAAIEQQLWPWSNWPRAKRKHARWVALYGESFRKVIADPLAGRVYFELIEPQYVTAYSVDVRDFLTDVRIDIPQCDEDRTGRTLWTHTEAWDKDLQSVRIWRTDGHTVADRPLWDLGAPIAETPFSAFGIDFIPIVRSPFREIDDGRALGAVQTAIEAIIEGDLSATNLHGLIFTRLNGAKVLKSIGNDATGRPFAPPIVGDAPADGQAGKQSNNTVLGPYGLEFWQLAGNQELQDVIPAIDYDAALAILQDHDTHLERLMPALAYVRISELQGGELSGRAMSYKMRAFVDQVEEGRANILASDKQANMMALTMGRAAGIFDESIGTFEAGDYEHDFAEQPILAISSLDEAEEKRTVAQAVQALASAGVPMSLILTNTMELSEQEATEIVDAAAEEAATAFERQQELVAAQPAQEDNQGGQFGAQ